MVTLKPRGARERKKRKKEKKNSDFLSSNILSSLSIKKKFWGKYTNEGSQMVTLKPRGARERKKRKKEKKIAIFFLVIFCQVCLLKKNSGENTRIKAVRWSHLSHAALANEKKERQKKGDFLSSNILSSLSNGKNF